MTLDLLGILENAHAPLHLGWRVVVENAAVSRQSFAIDADGHVLEPPDLWEKNLPKKLRDQAMRVVWNEEHQREELAVEGRIVLHRGVVGLGLAGRAFEDFKEFGKGIRYTSLTPAGFEPKARIEEHKKHRIDAAVLYPSVGLFLEAIRNPQLAAMHCRIYNDWIADYCSYDPERLIGVAAVPMQDVDEAVKEVTRAVRDLGLRGAFVRPNPCNGRHLDSPDFDPLWDALQELGVPVALHPSGTPDLWGACSLFRDYSRSIHAFQHSMNFSFDDEFAFSLLVGSGVLERFPRLKVAILESGGGWIPHWFDRMDHFHDVWRWTTKHLSLKPSEYFKRQAYISFDPDERSLPAVIDIVGKDRIIWASDFPHLDVTSDCIGRDVRENLKALSPKAQKLILSENAKSLYGLWN